MKDEILFILSEVYGSSMLNAIATDSIFELIKERSSCNLEQENENENDFKIGDSVQNINTFQVGVVAQNASGKIGFVFNGKWYSIMTKNIKKIL